MSECRRTVRTACCEHKPHVLHVLHQRLVIDIFRETVGGIVHALHLSEEEVAAADPILDPQIGDRQVSKFAQATPAAHTYSGGRVCENL